MSNYFDGSDTSDEETSKNLNATQSNTPDLTVEEKEALLEKCKSIKDEGNSHFSKANYDDALLKYTEALKLLKEGKQGKDPVIMLNRSATYLALKRYVPALNDANIACELDPNNWKGFWRKGIALMSMTKKRFRTQQAVEAFEKCLTCESLPENKKSDVIAEINKARAR